MGFLHNNETAIQVLAINSHSTCKHSVRSNALKTKWVKQGAAPPLSEIVLHFIGVHFNPCCPREFISAGCGTWMEMKALLSGFALLASVFAGTQRKFLR